MQSCDINPSGGDADPSRMSRAVYILLVALALCVAGAPAGASLRCQSIQDLSRAFLQKHIQHHEITEQLEQRTIDTYLRRADPSRSLLLQSEVEKIRGSLVGVFEDVRKGNCGRLEKLHETLVEQHRVAEKFVREIVGDDDYAIDTNAELVLDPDDRGHPATDAQRRALQLSLIHFQMSNYESAGTELEEARKRLLHRYELRSQRAADLDDEDLYAAFLDAFAASLDPHSSYLSAEVLEDFRISMSLSLEGIGVALSERDGYAVAEHIIPGGAADSANALLPKDKIIAVAQEGEEPVDIIDMPLRDAVALIRGKKGTKVHLTVLRQGETTERFTVSIVRDTIDLAEQAAKLRFEQVKDASGKELKLAVLELPSFYGDADPSRRQCTQDVAELLEQVVAAKADGLLLDLSRNGGGLLEHAVTISGYFIRRGEIVGIRDSRGKKQILSDRDDSVLYTGPLVVHTSRVSASASEILAGALKDYRRAVIVGDDHTFGKGTVQTVAPLPPGQGAIKVTTAMFFRPGGRSTQHDGVGSDVVLPSLLSADDYGEKNQEYSLEATETSPFLSSHANANGLSERWPIMSPQLMAKLSARSQARIDVDDDFAEIRRKLADASGGSKAVQLAEFMKEREESESTHGNGTTGTASGEAKPAPGDAATSVEGAETAPGEEDEPTPQLEEALRVLADLVSLLQVGKDSGGPRPIQVGKES
jgi:carboxyl-terminal processing protease